MSDQWSKQLDGISNRLAEKHRKLVSVQSWQGSASERYYEDQKTLPYNDETNALP